jgi:CheY-like chemotaxis protein
MTALTRQDRPDPASADLQWRFVDRFPAAEALSVGCDAYLTKPIRRLDLQSRVSQLLVDAK